MYNKKSNTKRSDRVKSNKNSNRSYNSNNTNIFIKNMKTEFHGNLENPIQNSNNPKYPTHTLYESKSNKQMLKDLSEKAATNIYNNKGKFNNSMINTSANLYPFKKANDFTENASGTKIYQPYNFKNG